MELSTPSDYFSRLLLDSLDSGFLKIFTALLQQEKEDGTSIVDPNYFYTEPRETTCVHEACSEGKSIEYLRALLRANANPNLVNVATRKAPIHVAIAEMNLPAVRLLLEQATLNINISDKHGDTPVHYVVKYVDDDQKAELLVRDMLDKGADVNIKNEEGNTAIMTAAVLRKKELVKAMLPETDIDKEVTDEVTLKTFLQTNLPDLGDIDNINRGSTDIRNRQKRKLFLMLYAENCEGFVKDLQKSKMNDAQIKELLNEDDGKNTFLQTACSLSHSTKAVKVLLKKGVDPNRTTKENGSPPLVMAAERKNYDVMKILLNAATDKINVNKKDRKGKTALHVVAKNRNLEMVVMLLNFGARMDVKNNLGKEPISTEAMKDLMNLSLQADEKMFPYDDEYRIKLCFGLFIQHRPQPPAPAQPSASTQEDVELAPLNGPAQVGTSSNVYNSCGAAEAARLCYITETHREDCILKHPLVQSFILLKWPKLQSYYFFYLTYVFIFVSTLLFNILKCHIMNACSKMVSEYATVLLYILLVGIVLIEVLQILTNYHKYIGNKDKLLVLAVIVCSMFIHWKNEVHLLIVMVSGLHIFMNLGKLSVLSGHWEILKIVTKKYLLTLFYYSILLVTILLYFFILLSRTSDTYSTFWSVIPSGLNVILGGDHTVINTIIKTPYFFIILIVLVCIVMLNLIHNMAISDMKQMMEDACLESIRARVRLINNIEQSLIKIYNLRIPLVCRMLSLDKIMIFHEGDHEVSVCFDLNVEPYVVIGTSGRQQKLSKREQMEIMNLLKSFESIISPGDVN